MMMRRFFIEVFSGVSGGHVVVDDDDYYYDEYVDVLFIIQERLPLLDIGFPKVGRTDRPGPFASIDSERASSSTKLLGDRA